MPAALAVSTQGGSRYVALFHSGGTIANERGVITVTSDARIEQPALDERTEFIGDTSECAATSTADYLRSALLPWTKQQAARQGNATITCQ